LFFCNSIPQNEYHGIIENNYIYIQLSSPIVAHTNLVHSKYAAIFPVAC